MTFKCLVCSDNLPETGLAPNPQEASSLFLTLAKALKLPTDNVKTITSNESEVPYLRLCTNCTKKTKFIAPVLETIEKLEETIRKFKEETLQEISNSFDVKVSVEETHDKAHEQDTKYRLVQKQLFKDLFKNATYSPFSDTSVLASTGVKDSIAVPNDRKSKGSPIVRLVRLTSISLSTSSNPSATNEPKASSEAKVVPDKSGTEALRRSTRIKATDRLTDIINAEKDNNDTDEEDHDAEENQDPSFEFGGNLDSDMEFKDEQFSNDEPESPRVSDVEDDFTSPRKSKRRKTKRTVNKTGIYQCDMCEKSYKNRKSLWTHKADVHTRKPKYECKDCGRAFLRLSNLKVHCSTVHVDLKCEKCEDNPSFDKRTEYMQHAITVHQDKSYDHLVCPTCSKVFANESVLCGHQIQVHGTVSRPEIAEKLIDTTCPICSKIFACKSAFNMHYETHMNERSYLCTTCGLAFKTKAVLRTHSVIHSKIEYSCDHCDKKFKTKERLKRHTKLHRKHEYERLGQPLFKCPHCPEGFSSEHRVKKHKAEAHGIGINNNTQQECPHCELVLPTRSLLVKHLNREHNDTSLGNTKCDICGACFTRVVALRAHKKVHSQDYKHFCDICGKGFLCESSLRRHGFAHSNVTFDCDECPKKFKEPGSLRYHKKKHEILNSGLPLPFECHICGKRFVNNSNLRVHIDTHDKLKNACICDLCGKSLAGRANLRHHLVNIHMLGKGRKPRRKPSKKKRAQTESASNEVEKGESGPTQKTGQSNDNNNDEVMPVEVSPTQLEFEIVDHEITEDEMTQDNEKVGSSENKEDTMAT